MMTLEEIVAKRRRSWDKRHDIEYDRGLVDAAVRYIHANKPLSDEVRGKPWRLIEIAFPIVDKTQRTVPFFLNEVQRDFVARLDKMMDGETERRPFFVLKGRQQGFTSLITAIQLACTIVRKNFTGFTVADCGDNTLSIFDDKARSVYNALPDVLKPSEQFNNRHELKFDKLGSSWRVATASKDIGRSKTLGFCHFSEVAFYQCPLADLQKSIGEALTSKAIVVYETTANGYNDAKDLWDSGTCTNLFYEWWRTAEYVSDDFSVFDNLKGEWIRRRVAWLRDKGLDERHIAWYVKKFNSYLDGEHSIKQEYPCVPDEAFIATGQSEFGDEAVVGQIDLYRGLQAVKRGYFEYSKRRTDDPEDVDGFVIDDIRWVDSPSGEIVIHKEPVVDDTKGKKPYSIGGDTAGEGSDYYTAKVVDNIDGDTVATYRRANTSDDLYAEQVYCLGKYYNDALVGIEVNFSYAPTKRLLDAGYSNLYKREAVDTYTDAKTVRFGFRTTAQTRPVIIAELKRVWRESVERPEGGIEPDVETLREMLTFVRDERGKPQAIAGKHDDLVMALAIAHHVAAQGDHTWQEPKAEENILAKMFNMEDTATRSAADEYIGWDD